MCVIVRCRIRSYVTWLVHIWLIHKWLDSFIHRLFHTWLIHMWHDSFIWLIHMWLRHATWLLHTHSPVPCAYSAHNCGPIISVPWSRDRPAPRDQILCVTWLIHTSDTWFVGHDSFICVTRLIHPCALISRLPRALQSKLVYDMPDSYMWHIICWTRLFYRRDMTHSSERPHLDIAQHSAIKSCVWRGAFTCCTRIIHMHDILDQIARLLRTRGGGLGSRPKKMYGERLGDGVEYHLMKPTPRR